MSQPLFSAPHLSYLAFITSKQAYLSQLNIRLMEAAQALNGAGDAERDTLFLRYAKAWLALDSASKQLSAEYLQRGSELAATKGLASFVLGEYLEEQFTAFDSFVDSLGMLMFELQERFGDVRGTAQPEPAPVTWASVTLAQVLSGNFYFGDMEQAERADVERLTRDMQTYRDMDKEAEQTELRFVETLMAHERDLAAQYIRYLRDNVDSISAAQKRNVYYFRFIAA